MHLNLEMKNMTLSLKVTNLKQVIWGTMRKKKIELNLNGTGSIT